MIHNVRRKDGTIYPLDVELGSGIADKNGKEIFEGDRVAFKDKIGYVVFRHGNFILDNNRELNHLLSGVDYDGNLEIVD